MPMKQTILGLLTATAVAAPLVLALAGPASAATINHGQCVSGAVKAGVTGAAFEAIAKNNALVGAYGSTTCPTIVVAPTPDKAISDNLTWDFNDGTTHVTGTTTFNVDNSGSGSLTYTAANGNVLYGDITPGTYQKLDAHTAIFSGTIVAGSSPDYLANPLGGNYFFAKIVDGTPDMVAVLANQVVPGTWITSATDADALAATTAYPMGVGTAGIVTTGNLTIN
jgi:hypothetical protein